jgi:pilus assembly protein CpaE
MDTDAITCGLKVWNEVIARQLEEVISSLPGFRIQNAVALGPWDVIILEVSGKGGDEFDFARGALLSGMVKNVFLTSPGIDLNLLKEALVIGAKGFFRQPIDKAEVKGALLKIREQLENSGLEKTVIRKGKIIDVLGAKGGVGTTTVAVNLAASMLELEGVESVALVDMNEPFGDIPLFLNMDRAANWAEVSKNIARLDATFLMSMLFKHASGLFVLPAPETIVEDGRIPQVMETILGLMQGLFDYVIVDGGRSLNATSRSILRLSDKVVLVTVLALPSLVHVRRYQEIFRGLGYPPEERVHIVANRLVKKSDIKIEEAEATLKKKISWSLPNDYRITMSAINQGKPLGSVDHGAEANVRVRGLAAFLAEKKEKKKGRKGLFG